VRYIFLIPSIESIFRIKLAQALFFFMLHLKFLKVEEDNCRHQGLSQSWVTFH